MQLRPRALAARSPRSLTATSVAALMLAAALGAVVAQHVVIGLALLAAVVYLPLVFLDLPAAVAVWVVLAFFEGFPGAALGPEAAGLAVGAGWVALLVRDPGRARALARRHATLLTGLALFLVWLTLSLLWTGDAGAAAGYLWSWLWVAGLFLIVATTIAGRRDLRLVLFAFVAGAAGSVVLGFAAEGLGTSAGAETAAEGGRLEGAAGDPNYLAAQLVPALAIATGLLITSRGLVTRWALTLAIGVIALGLVASGSRGGLIAAAVVAVLALAVFRGRRAPVAAGLVGLVAMATVWFAANPAAWERVAGFREDAGSGRTELWQIGWRIVEDHPVTGVGLLNFGLEAPAYTREPGSLQFVYHVERAQAPHNVYLGLWAESGLVGLLLFLFVPVGALRAAWIAAERFERRGEHDFALLARTVFVGTAGALTASFFLPNGTDKRLWILMATAVALLGVAERRAGTAARRAAFDAGR